MEVLTMNRSTSLNVDFRKSLVQNYINNFRILLSQYLKPSIGIQAKAFPYDKGSILEFEFGQTERNLDEIKSISYSVEEALKKAHMQIGEIPSSKTINFQGTNIIVQDNKIYLIKDFSDKEWTKEQAEKDLEKILHSA